MPIRDHQVHGRWDHRSLWAFGGRLNSDLSVSILHLLTNGMDRIIILFTDGVISLRGRRNGVIYDDLKQVQVGIDGSNFFQAILKFIIVVDAAHIKKGRETWNFATALASALSICS